MERKAVIVGAVVLVAAGVVAAVMWSGDGDQGDGATPIAGREGDESSGGSDGSHVGSSASHSSGSSAGGAGSSALSRAGEGDTLGDGGVRRPRAPDPAERPPTVNTHGALQESPEDAERSAGWRLGQARARIEMVETRVSHLRENLAAAERGGDPAATEQQRTILRRFEARLTALRAQEPALEEQARQDGTLGDVSRGMQEGVGPALPSRAPPTRAP